MKTYYKINYDYENRTATVKEIQLTKEEYNFMKDNRYWTLFENKADALYSALAWEQD